MSTKLNLGSITAKEICSITASKLVGFEDAEILSVSTDSRKISAGDLFVAIKGENFDGNDYVSSAFSLGAVAALTNKAPDNVPDGCAVIICDDTVAALGKLARAYRHRINMKTVAITGSVGKTTTKEMIASVLSEKYNVIKTEGNLNTDIGVSLSLIGAKPDTEIAVLEMGMSNFGEIEKISKIAEPDYGVITNIGTSHIEYLGSREGICKAKTEIVSGMKNGGELVLCGDEPLLAAFRCGNVTSTYVSVYNAECEIRAVNIDYSNNTTKFDIICGPEVICGFQVPAIGVHHVYSALFAYAVGKKLGLDDKDIMQGFIKFKNAAMRQTITNIGGITVIDASYNASPESMRASVDVLCLLAKEKRKKKYALLGDMRELGSETRKAHEALGEFIVKKNLDGLFTLGVAAEFTAQSARDFGMPENKVHSNMDITSPETSASQIIDILKKGDIILVKASRAVAAEKIISMLKEHFGESEEE